MRSATAEQSSKRRREEIVEAILFNESNKCTKSMQRSILQLFTKMETIAITMIEQVARLEGRLHERSDLEHLVARKVTSVPPSPVQPTSATGLTFAHMVAKPIPKKNNK